MNRLGQEKETYRYLLPVRVECFHPDHSICLSGHVYICKHNHHVNFDLLHNDFRDDNDYSHRDPQPKKRYISYNNNYTIKTNK